MEVCQRVHDSNCVETGLDLHKSGINRIQRETRSGSGTSGNLSARPSNLNKSPPGAYCRTAWYPTRSLKTAVKVDHRSRLVTFGQQNKLVAHWRWERVFRTYMLGSEREASEAERENQRMTMRTVLEVLSSEAVRENQRMSMRSLGLEFL